MNLHRAIQLELESIDEGFGALKVVSAFAQRSFDFRNNGEGIKGVGARKQVPEVHTTALIRYLIIAVVFTLNIITDATEAQNKALEQYEAISFILICDPS